jgi:hypothetical protein
MENPDKLRELAAWYREFADRTGNSAIWDTRLRTAVDLEAAADRLEPDSLPCIPGLGGASSWNHPKTTRTRILVSRPRRAHREPVHPPRSAALRRLP